MGLSGLNAYRRQYHFIDFSTCPKCQFKIEDPLHFILDCPSYAAQRAEMLEHLSSMFPNIILDSHSRLRKIRKQVLDILLFGTSVEENDKKIFNYVSLYIKETKRFT
mgnify:FL=1